MHRESARQFFFNKVKVDTCVFGENTGQVEPARSFERSGLDFQQDHGRLPGGTITETSPNIKHLHGVDPRFSLLTSCASGLEEGKKEGLFKENSDYM